MASEYHEPDVITFPTWLGLSKGGHHRRRRANFTIGDKPGIDEDSAADAAAANFVHSVDAAHLQLVALAAEQEGIRLVTVHDCYGTHAPHAERLNEIILDQFVRLHKRNNLLNEVRESARRDLPKGTKLPPLPELGTLDIDDVRNCPNAFK
jgi:DNA-directed RNA polymerase